MCNPSGWGLAARPAPLCSIHGRTACLVSISPSSGWHTTLHELRRQLKMEVEGPPSQPAFATAWVRWEVGAATSASEWTQSQVFFANVGTPEAALVAGSVIFRCSTHVIKWEYVREGEVPRVTSPEWVDGSIIRVSASGPDESQLWTVFLAAPRTVIDAWSNALDRHGNPDLIVHDGQTENAQSEGSHDAKATVAVGLGESVIVPSSALPQLETETLVFDNEQAPSKPHPLPPEPDRSSPPPHGHDDELSPRTPLGGARRDGGGTGPTAGKTAGQSLGTVPQKQHRERSSQPPRAIVDKEILVDSVGRASSGRVGQIEDERLSSPAPERPLGLRGTHARGAWHAPPKPTPLVRHAEGSSPPPNLHGQRPPSSVDAAQGSRQRSGPDLQEGQSISSGKEPLPFQMGGRAASTSPGVSIAVLEFHQGQELPRGARNPLTAPWPIADPRRYSVPAHEHVQKNPSRQPPESPLRAQAGQLLTVVERGSETVVSTRDPPAGLIAAPEGKELLEKAVQQWSMRLVRMAYSNLIRWAYVARVARKCMTKWATKTKASAFEKWAAAAGENSFKMKLLTKAIAVWGRGRDNALLRLAVQGWGVQVKDAKREKAIEEERRVHRQALNEGERQKGILEDMIGGIEEDMNKVRNAGERSLETYQAERAEERAHRLYIIGSRAIQRWQGDCKRSAFSIWVEEKRRRARSKVIVQNCIQRLRLQVEHRVFTAWVISSLSEVMDRERGLRENGEAELQTVHIENERLREMSTGLSVLQARTLLRATQAFRRKELRLSFMRLRDQSMERSHQRELLGKAVRRLLWLSLHRAFSKWHVYAKLHGTHRRSTHTLTNTYVNGMNIVWLQTVFEAWRTHVKVERAAEERLVERQAMETTIHKLENELDKLQRQHAELADLMIKTQAKKELHRSAWGVDLHEAGTEAKLKTVLSKQCSATLARWMRRQKWAAWLHLRGYSAAKARQRRLLIRAIHRILHLRLARAFHTWAANSRNIKSDRLGRECGMADLSREQLAERLAEVLAHLERQDVDLHRTMQERDEARRAMDKLHSRLETDRARLDTLRAKLHDVHVNSPLRGGGGGDAFLNSSAARLAQRAP